MHVALSSNLRCIVILWIHHLGIDFFIEWDINPLNIYWMGYWPIEHLLNEILAHWTFFEMGYWPIEHIVLHCILCGVVHWRTHFTQCTIQPTLSRQLYCLLWEEDPAVAPKYCHDVLMYQTRQTNHIRNFVRNIIQRNVPVISVLSEEFITKIINKLQNGGLFVRCMGRKFFFFSSKNLQHMCMYLYVR